jgi:hypothetical protein
VELHVIRTVPIPRRNRHWRIFGVRIDISRENRTGLLASTVSPQFLAAFFSMPQTRGAARERIAEQPRTAERNSLAPQYVMPGTT